MARKLSEPARAAAAIRKELKAHNIKASVTSESYSMGSSVRVEIKADILPATLAAIKEYCADYEYGHFDGMTDQYHMSNNRDDIPQVRHLFVNVEYSKAIRERAFSWLCERRGGYEHILGLLTDNETTVVNGEQIGRTVDNILHVYGAFSVDKSFWTTVKRRAKA